jgi:hypothetical protein
MVLVFAAACGSDDNGGGNGSGTHDAAIPLPDAPRFLDAPATNVAQITVSGTAEEISTSGSGALAGVLIEAFRNGDETTPIASTTTDGLGDYSLTIDTNGEQIDGFLKATKTGFKTTYLYPPYPLEQDFTMASVFMIKQSTFETLHLAAGATEMMGKGTIALIVTDGANPVAGTKVTSTPAPTPPDARYNAMVGTLTLPSSTAMTTHTDGIAYLFNLPPGKVMVGAQKTGMMFKSHQVKAWPDELTTTVVVP